MSRIIGQHKRTRWVLGVVVFLLGAQFAMAAGNPVPLPNRPAIQKRLNAMTNSSTWGHPDLFGRFNGMVAFAAGHYRAALKMFRYGAFYADKLSQLSIGLMYLNGNGVKKNPAKAWAWLAIAASRDYPVFVTTRNRVWKILDPAQRQAAQAEHKVLAKTYGDAVAIPRIKGELRQTMLQITGSRSGFNNGISTIALGPGGNLRQGLTMTPNNFDARNAWYWNPKHYIARRDANWSGTVQIGKLQQLGTPPSGAHATGKQPQP
ncbi:MAG TPA: sel1 repeat family protein [Mizugakiibacter sp.]|nr:sel1 repeat family protein [Mizugakiibacter sp.]